MSADFRVEIPKLQKSLCFG